MQDENSQPKLHKRHTIKNFSVILLLVCALAAAGYIGYIYSRIQTSNEASASNTPATQQAKPTDQPKQDQVHYVEASLNPSGKKVEILTKLAVPNNLQAIQYSSSVGDPGYSNELSTSMNGELGRWRFGRPDSTDPGSFGDVGLYYLDDDWLNTTLDFQQTYDNTLLADYFSPNMTPAKKQAFITKLAKNTNDCQTTHKGFVIDERIKVCYKPEYHPQARYSYDPVLDLIGYGKIQDMPVVLVGWLRLNDATEYSKQQNEAFTSQFLKGNIPQHTQEAINDYVGSVKQTRIQINQR